MIKGLTGDLGRRQAWINRGRGWPLKGIGYSGPSLRNEILENIAATFPQTNLIRRDMLVVVRTRPSLPKSCDMWSDHRVTYRMLQALFHRPPTDRGLDAAAPRIFEACPAICAAIVCHVADQPSAPCHGPRQIWKFSCRDRCLRVSSLPIRPSTIASGDGPEYFPSPCVASSPRQPPIT